MITWNRNTLKLWCKYR